MAADQGGFEDRCGEAVLAFLEDEAEFAGDGAAAKLLQGFAVDAYVAASWVIESAQGVQQGALAGAVGAEDAPGLAGFHAQAERPAVGAFGDVDDEFAGLEYAHQRLRYSSTRKVGTPSSAVMTPTGSCSGAMTMRARVSASVSSAPPPRAQAGRMRRWSLPRTRRSMCGTTSPTKPMLPAVVTARAVSRLARM